MGDVYFVNTTVEPHFFNVAISEKICPELLATFSPEVKADMIRQEIRKRKEFEDSVRQHILGFGSGPYMAMFNTGQFYIPVDAVNYADNAKLSKTGVVMDGRVLVRPATILPLDMFVERLCSKHSEEPVTINTIVEFSERPMHPKLRRSLKTLYRVKTVKL